MSEIQPIPPLFAVPQAKFPPVREFREAMERDSIDARFAEFDAAHPDIFALFRQFAAELLNAGRTRYSADAILHRVRWHCDTSAHGSGSPTINNDFTSRYARKLAATDKRFADFFEFRSIRG